MSERTKKFEVELDKLVAEGTKLLVAIQFDCKPSESKKAYLATFGGDQKKLADFVNKLPNFRESYQEWYSKAQAIIRQIMPGRLSDFISYFDVPKGRKDISFQNYMIRDYLQVSK
ncbi:hypothetical protein RB623_02155 [Mesorhizobium sp. LHD-90]|uniref:hypothetical protein n=1 Tax=Mesorhizobium sp. LHD-90 TaxID=3071414 RepID=UPI0027E02E59|nr:hypothetical protein [Mesorhizobium sp. LHD-90]MDQ6432854.1 hypothetical protein [Mesorhizobium sp. LHD-90]